MFLKFTSNLAGKGRQQSILRSQKTRRLDEQETARDEHCNITKTRSALQLVWETFT